MACQSDSTLPDLKHNENPKEMVTIFTRNADNATEQHRYLNQKMDNIL